MLSQLQFSQKGTGNVGSANCNDFYDRTKMTLYYAIAPLNNSQRGANSWVYYITIPFRDSGYAIQIEISMQQNIINQRRYVGGSWTSWSAIV